MKGAARRLGADLFATRADRQTRIETRSLHSLAALLFLVQVPHLAHLPIWISGLGIGIVLLRLYDLHAPGRTVLARLLSPLVLSGAAATAAVLIRLDYGYFLGRDPCVAFLFVLVAGKFAEVRRRSDTTLLLCLAAFLLLTQYFYSQTLLSALVTLPAVVALGNALTVLRDPSVAITARRRFRLVGKLLLQGLPIATLLFFVFPRLPGPLWSLPEDSMAVTGLSDSMAPGNIGSLSQSSAVAFRVEFDGEIPPVESRYWRGPVLTRFDGRRWQVGATPSFIPLRAGEKLDDPRRIDYTVMLQPHRQRWLFALDAPISLPIGSTGPSGDRRAAPLAQLTDDVQLIAHEPVAQLLRYRQSSVPTDRFVSRRRPSDETLALAGRNRRTVAFATELRRRQPADAAFAEAVLERFNQQDYRYTLSPQLLGDAPVDEFLFDSREGFCEHYAAAFVVMMRAAGIPARVVTGYLGGEMNGDYMIVRQSDAHAWTEAWIDGAWRRYDPTGAVAPERIEHGIAAALPDSRLVPRLARLDGSWLNATRLRWDAINHGWQRLVVDFDNESQDAMWKRLGLPDPELWQLMSVVLAAAAIWCLVLLGLPGWRRNGTLTPIEAAWVGYVGVLERHGIVRENGERPLDYVQRAALNLSTRQYRIERVGLVLHALRFTLLDVDEQARRLNSVRTDLRRLQWRAAWRRRPSSERQLPPIHARDPGVSGTNDAGS